MRDEGLDLTIRSGDGNVEVDLDPGISLFFTIRTRNGSLRMSGIEVADLQKDKPRTSGRIGGGRGSMRITMGDGEVTLRQE